MTTLAGLGLRHCDRCSPILGVRTWVPDAHVQVERPVRRCMSVREIESEQAGSSRDEVEVRDATTEDIVGCSLCESSSVILILILAPDPIPVVEQEVRRSKLWLAEGESILLMGHYLASLDVEPKTSSRNSEVRSRACTSHPSGPQVSDRMCFERTIVEQMLGFEQKVVWPPHHLQRPFRKQFHPMQHRRCRKPFSATKLERLARS